MIHIKENGDIITCTDGVFVVWKSKQVKPIPMPMFLMKDFSIIIDLNYYRVNSQRHV